MNNIISNSIRTAKIIQDSSKEIGEFLIVEDNDPEINNEHSIYIRIRQMERALKILEVSLNLYYTDKE